MPYLGIPLVASQAWLSAGIERNPADSFVVVTALCVTAECGH